MLTAPKKDEFLELCIVGCASAIKNSCVIAHTSLYGASSAIIGANQLEFESTIGVSTTRNRLR